MSKQVIIDGIVAQLVRELDIYVKAATAARAEATHEQSKAENKYDTRGLEASYLARGQSRQAAEIEQAIEQFQNLSPRDFSSKDPIDLGALVTLQNKRERFLYFVGPRAGGTEVDCNGETLVVITPQSPLGQQLIGKKQGDRLQITIAGTRDEYRVLSVS